jgi:CheY-like chemotaxis protein
MVQRTLHQDVVLEAAAPDEAGPLLVEADANQLQQALINLAVNARDALREAAVHDAPGGATGRPTALVFRLRPEHLTGERPAFPQSVPPGDYVLVEVEDHGPGMTPEVLSQALDPFFTTKDVGQGTGLGLPMVFGIVQGHQGYLTIDTGPGRGTCVGLYLPRAADAAPAAHPGPAPLAAEVVEPECSPGRSILVIDDEEAVLDVVRRFLEIAGHRVTCATSGYDALELLANGRPVDLVILDLMMPREDTAATFHRLRQRRPGVPVLLCTGLPQADPVPALLRDGATGLIHKPFRMNELWYAVTQALTPAGGG